MDPLILTRSGNYFDLLHPEGSLFSIKDIAHGLSNLCRFTGHCREFYSVAQHSILVSRICSQELKFAALMHDAAEAFLGDVSSPLKHLLPEYKRIEENVERAIFNRFHVPWDQAKSDEVKKADLILLATEKRDLMPTTGYSWEILKGIGPLDFMWIHPLPPEKAFNLFMEEYNKLDIPGGIKHYEQHF